MKNEESNDDEEISIDFSKITNFFKRKKQDTPHTVNQVEKAEHQIEKHIKEKKEEIKDIKDGIKELKEEESQLEDIKEKIYEKKEEKKAQKVIEKVEESAEDNETSDDEISFDFSKVKKFFKSDDKETVSDDKASDDEISFDFSKIKSFFKREKQSTEDDISFDFQKLMAFTKKYQIILLILIPIIFSIYARSMPAQLPVTDDWAANSVHNYFRNQIQAQINQKYPNLPDANKNALVEEEFRKALKQQKANIDAQVEQTSQYFKSRMQDDNGHTYLIAIDPYFWLRKTRNIIDHGNAGDELRDGKPYNTYMLAPLGRIVFGDMFHPYFSAAVFKTFKIFNPSLTPMRAAFFTPLIIMSLAAIPAFFIGRRFGGNIGGLTASLLVVAHPAVMTRTVAGFADTDSYNILFPLLVSWMILISHEAHNFKKRLTFAALGGLFAGIYSMAWGGWWFILDFIVILLIVYTIFIVISQRKSLAEFIKSSTFKNVLLTLVVFIVAAGIATTVFNDFGNFIRAPLSPLQFAAIKEVGISKVWPNVFTTVAEQNEIPLSSIISQSGGRLLFIIAMLGVLLALTRFKEKTDYAVVIGSLIWWMILFNMASSNSIQPLAFIVLIMIPYLIKTFFLIRASDANKNMFIALLLTVWIAATLFASTKGVRWVLLLAPAFSIGLGLAFGLIYKFSAERISRALHVKQIISKSVILIIIAFLISPFLSAGLGTARNEIPSMNDAWYNSLDKINLEASPDAIINSWWDFGHWFKAIGNRAVTFDGASQNTPMAHWIGSALLTSDEKTAVGILRMLDCGSNTAFDNLDAVIQKPYRSVEILYDIIVLDKEEAADTLIQEGLTDQQAHDVLKFSHCDPPENYFIASEDMIGKSGVWAHFGSWDFERATMFNKIKNVHTSKDSAVSYLSEEFNLSEAESNSIYFDIQSLSTSRDVNNWIAPWPGYTSGLNGCSNINLSLWRCRIKTNQGALTFTADVDTGEVELPSRGDNPQHPSVVGFINPDGEFTLREYQDNKIEMGISIIPASSGYAAVLSSPVIVGSMFNRQFFYQGHGLKYFEPFTHERSFNNQNIYIYNVDWDGAQNNVMPAYQDIIESQTEIEASHILVNTSEAAAEILQLLEEGEDFETLAKTFSIDPSAQANGGYLGFFRKGMMVPEFEAAAYALDVGEISPPIKTQFGYHIIKVTDKRRIKPGEIMKAPEILKPDTGEAVEEVPEELNDTGPNNSMPESSAEDINRTDENASQEYNNTQSNQSNSSNL